MRKHDNSGRIDIAKGMRGTLLCATAMLGVLGAVPHSLAQTLEATDASADTINAEILVTARRQDERLQDVPVAITAVAGAALEERSIMRVDDLPRIAPSFSSSGSARGSSNPAYAIRGIKGPAAQTLLLDPAISLYFADFNLSRGTGTNQTLYDLQSVQILRGPQGTLFGRNSTGGAVLFEPNRPTDEFGGYISAGFGSYDQREIEGVLNLPISSTLALRVSGNYSARRGYMHDVVNDRHLNGVDAKSMRAILRWQPSAAVTSDTMATYFISTPTDTAFKAYRFNPQAVSAALGVAAPVYINAVQAELAATNALGKYEVRLPVGFGGKLHDRAVSLQNNSTIDLGSSSLLGDLTVKNVIGYRSVTNRIAAVQLVGLGLDINQFANEQLKSNQFSGELQLQGKKGAFSYIVGAFFFRESGTDGQDAIQYSYLTSPAFRAAATPAQIAFANARFPTIARQDNAVRNTSYAAFVHADLELIEGLHFAGGFRMTHDDRSVVYRGQSTSGATPTVYTCDLVPVTTTTFNGDACAAKLTTQYTKPTYDANVSYKISPDVLAYASFSHGYRAGGLVNRALLASINTARFKPEFIDSYEVGLKTDWRLGELRGRFNVSLFTAKMSDLQRTLLTVQPNGSSQSVITNASSLRNKGGEFEFSVTPVRNIEIYANYSFIRPHYIKFLDTQVIGGVSTPIDISDSGLPFVPYNQFSAGINVTLPLGDDVGQIVSNLGVSGQSRTQQQDINTANCGPTGTYLNCLNRLSALDGYSLVDFRATWENVAGRNIDLSFFVTNLTNKFYRNYANVYNGTFGISAAIIGQPRMFGATAKFSFGS